MWITNFRGCLPTQPGVILMTILVTGETGTIVQGDVLDVDSLRGALNGVSTLFLLNAVVADEFTQALIVLNLAREAGVERIVYLSVIHSDLYSNVPHFAAKFAVERMIEQM